MDNNDNPISREIEERRQADEASASFDVPVPEVRRTPSIHEIATLMRQQAVHFANHLSELEIPPDQKVIGSSGSEEFVWVFDLRHHIEEEVAQPGLRYGEGGVADHINPRAMNEFNTPTGIGIDINGELVLLSYPEEMTLIQGTRRDYPFSDHTPTLKGRVNDEELVYSDRIEAGKSAEEQQLTLRWHEGLVKLGMELEAQQSSDSTSSGQGSCEWAQTYDYWTMA